ncbi:MAG: KH domain-containing protein [Clostridia bacterium]|nr:KH domain-containing protein [Clostridia bacterium]
MSRVLADMARAIVDHPEKVSVTESENEDGILLTLSVDEEDMGMVIGKHGKIARALRTVMKAAAKIADKKITVDIQ